MTYFSCCVDTELVEGTCNSLTVKWTAIKDAVKYILQYKKTSSEGAWKEKRANKTKVKISTLPSSTMYTVRVQVFRRNASMLLSAEKNFTTYAHTSEKACLQVVNRSTYKNNTDVDTLLLSQRTLL